MANSNDLTAQAHLAAGMQKLEALRRQFLIYLERKEKGVYARSAAGQTGDVVQQPATDLTEWLE